ncbi:polysaccharide deacetylase family protein [Catellatospora sp. NPDC049111]|uniref:polysaccharide deacetylase family protein n=1 Tax=Catellatospora sp. NPDC049111 TaxID=3155271 RepID=UPI0033CF2E3A
MRAGSAPGNRRRAIITALVLTVVILVGGFMLGHLAGSHSRTGLGDRSDLPKTSRDRVGPYVRLALPPLPPRPQPITGPDRPPLPAEKGGPFGSRLTTGTPEIALTFDDGPDEVWTPQVLALLRDYGVRATFCMIGAKAAKHPQLVRDVVADGHTLCNHSWSHDVFLGLRDEQAVLADMRRANEALTSAAPSARVSYYRQPGGNWSPVVVAAARRLGMTALHWRVDPNDWQLGPSYRIAADVTEQAAPGAIVLLHDGGGDRARTLSALRTILANLITRFHLAPLPPGMEEPRPSGTDWFGRPGQ